MNVPVLWKQNLQNLPDKNEIIDEMIGQIRKDFSMFSLDFVFTEKAHDKYVDLFEQLEKYLNLHFSKNTEKLYPILYRIDILEKDIQKAIHQQENYNFIGNITEQIILKELQKVLIRRHYKEKYKE
jgi:hypothetical protein